VAPLLLPPSSSAAEQSPATDSHYCRALETEERKLVSALNPNPFL